MSDTRGKQAFPLKPLDVTKLTDRELKNLIDNHRAKNATDRPVYLEALKEEAVRRGRGLTFDKSLNAIRKSAAKGKFLSYKDLASESGVEWEQQGPLRHARASLGTGRVCPSQRLANAERNRCQQA